MAARTTPPLRTPRPRPAAAARPQPPDLHRLAARWQAALDGADRALASASRYVPGDELSQRQNELREERGRTMDALARFAREMGIRPVPWLPPGPVTPRMLGLAQGVKACICDLEGVLTDSGVLHAHAWREVFDELLLRLSERGDRAFIPFDPDADYRDHIEGRPRLEGIHTFLASRGIRLPEGRVYDPSDADTAYGLEKRKADALARVLRQRGVGALPGARRYLEAADYAGVACAVVSASTGAASVLERTGLAPLVDESLGAEAIRTGNLRSRPAPDLLLAACRRLDVAPADAVTLTHSPAGVAAGHASGIAVIGVGTGARADLLRGFGAEHVVPSLAALLDRRLTAD